MVMPPMFDQYYFLPRCQCNILLLSKNISNFLLWGCLGNYLVISNLDDVLIFISFFIEALWRESAAKSSEM
jgi:hypothetical protein